MKSLSCVRLFATPWTATYQATLTMGFPRQEYWSGLPFPSPGDLPDPGTKLHLLLWQVDSLLLSYPYTTTGKTIAFSRRAFISKVMSLLFNILSRLVIVYLSRSKCLLISWLQSPSVVILEPKKIKSGIVSIVSPSICHGVRDRILKAETLLC